MQSEENPWKTLSSTDIYENAWIRLREDKVIKPNGEKGIYGVVHFKYLAIGIIPLDEENHTWLVGQHRYPLNSYSWEIPMGGGKLEVEPLVSAQRELKEETGLMARHWEELLRIHTSNSVTDELGIVYVARGLTAGDTAFDDTEKLQIWKMPFEQALQMALNGHITDSLSLAGIFKLALLMKKI
ncbi:MAG: NUDIX hydrolase [Flammeovirgaceae bacterium]|nr:NUDIX hydrolase [Flammeovirgaceae bacterium]MDW8287217.1 NUDIX hydrolase [Flammeovirgaceae bacterium]